MERKNIGYVFDWKMVARAYKISYDLNNEYDHFTVIEGKEGTGKSTLAVQLMAWVSPTADIYDICYNMRQYINKMKEIAEQYEQNKLDENDKSLLLDEGGIDLFSRESMKNSNKMLAKTFFIQRFLNTHIITCIPKFRYLDTTMRDHRVKTLITVTRRGDYKVITGEGINQVNKALTKEREVCKIAIPYGYFYEGHFSKDFPRNINKIMYEAHKFKNIKEFLKEADNDNTEESNMLTAREVERRTGISHVTIAKKIKEGVIKGKKLGSRWLIPFEQYESLIKCP